MTNDVVALYRNEEQRSEVEITSDPDSDRSPFQEEEWVSFPTSRTSEWNYGTERVCPETLRDRVEDARKTGGIAIPVSIQAQSHVIFTAGEAEDQGTPYQYGYLIVTAKGLKDLGFRREETIRQAKLLLEAYNLWANGHSWRCTTYEVEKCNLGHWHRQEPESHDGYIGYEYEETGILEDAGIRSGNPPTVNPGWTKVEVQRTA